MSNKKARGHKQQRRKDGWVAKCGVCVFVVVVAVVVGVVLSRFTQTQAPPQVHKHNTDNLRTQQPAQTTATTPQQPEVETSGAGDGDNKSNKNNKEAGKEQWWSPADVNSGLMSVGSEAATEPLSSTTTQARARGVCAGGHFSAALDKQNHKRVWVWGLVMKGMGVIERPLGVDFDEELSEIACGSDHLLVRSAQTNKVWSIGRNNLCRDDDNDGDGDEEDNKEDGLTPRLVCGGSEEDGADCGRDVVKMAAGHNTDAFLNSDGALFVRGNTMNMSLKRRDIKQGGGVEAGGEGRWTDKGECTEQAREVVVDKGFGKVVDVSVGSSFMAVLVKQQQHQQGSVDDGDDACDVRVLMSGSNAFGAMGNAQPLVINKSNNKEEQGSVGEQEEDEEVMSGWFEVVLGKAHDCCAAQVSCGGDHTLVKCADNSTVFGCGWNGMGQLGTHDKQDRDVFESIALGVDGGGGGSGDSASFVLWGDGTMSSAGSVDGSEPTKEAFSLVELPQLSSSPSPSSSQSSMQSATTQNSGEGDVDESSKDGPSNKEEEKKERRSGAKEVRSGFMHTVVLMEDGRVFVFGSGLLGQLGDGAERSSHTAARWHKTSD